MAGEPRAKRNWAGAAGAWSARHRGWAVASWLLFVIVAVVIGQAIGTTKPSQGESGPGDSGRAERILDAAGFGDQASEVILVQSKTATIGSPEFRAAIDGTLSAIRSTPYVKNVRSPLDAATKAVSKDAHSALIQFDLAGDSDLTSKRITPVLDAVARSQRAHPTLRIEEFGEASSDKALNKALGGDLRHAEVLSLPITLIILFFVFGALVAAVLPVGLAITAFLAAAGLLAPLSKIIHTDETASTVMLLVGMAVGVDYSLFYLRREREERQAGRSPQQALAVAAATSGRSVLVSGLTVIVAMAGMFLAGDATFSAVAEATILVVFVAVIGSVTILPALLTMLGDRVDRGRLPLLGQRRSRGTSHLGGVSQRAWGAVLGRVTRRPALYATLAAAVLVALAVPALGMKAASPGATDIPAKLPIMQTYARIQQAFPGGAGPANIVVQARDVTSPPVTAALKSLEQRALATGQARAPFSVQISPDHTVAVASVGLVGNGTDSASVQALKTMRSNVIPAAFAGSGVSWVGVTGQTAGSVDFNKQLEHSMPLVIGFVLIFAFLLLLYAFRSLVVPLVAIGLNLLSVAAAYGVLVLVFQHSWAEGILNFTSTGTIANWLPLFLFALLFGLSMDYHVFILSRIREAYDRGQSTQDAVASGIRSTAGVVTSAAAVMVAVFAIFATLSQVSIKQVGVGLGVAVLVDATLVRAILLPAVMTLLGERNWYLPRWLQWLPQASHEVPAPAPAMRPLDRRSAGLDP
ncbi:MAG: drug exporter of the superfamily-like protein, partial [Mycobacterium sp.]|nr:drug exporter of the superfamily-like protein [Mycobacterium sp.]